MGAFLTSLIITVVIFLFTPIMGAIGGWLFAGLFPESFQVLLDILRVDATGVEVGLALGFVGAFLAISK